MYARRFVSQGIDAVRRGNVQTFLRYAQGGCGRPSSTTMRMNWSRQAELDSKNIYYSTDCPVLAINGTLDRQLDLSSPREWLEYWPDGAYTVMRCDFFDDGITEKWKIWGSDFHLQRLGASYASFVLYSGTMAGSLINQNETLTAVLSTHENQQFCERLIQNLLREAANELLKHQNKHLHQTFMVTLLYHPLDPTDRRENVKMRAHICSTATDNVPALPASVRVSLAMNESLPHRMPNPTAKLSSWCRERRAIENMYKVDGVNEVILTMPSKTHSSSSSRILLEGLTSNLFVILENGSLQTSPDELVLGGYARHLILKEAQRLGLTVIMKPPRLDDAASWKGVFLTSSIRLLVPVNEIILVSNDEVDQPETTTVWSLNTPHPLCRQLLVGIHDDSLGDCS
ncbi:hypothetical protein MPSEU_000191300 [Mayamaea pseudoterrestris]|nr:hypothetical protein MPSEU_000191300 [Mayamaea pseudoterrestris]